MPNMRKPAARKSDPRQRDIFLPHRSATMPVGTSRIIMAAENTISSVNILA